MSLPSEKSQWQLHSFHGSSHKPRVLTDGPLSLPFYVQSKSRSCQPYLQSISIQNWAFLSVSTAPIQAWATTLSCSQSFLSAFLGPFYSPTQKIRVMTQNLRQLMPLFSELARAVHHTQKGNQGTSTWSAPPGITCIPHSPLLSSLRALLGSGQLFLQKSSLAWVTVTLLLAWSRYLSSLPLTSFTYLLKHPLGTWHSQTTINK